MPGRSEEGISEHRRSQNRESQRRFRQRQRERNAAKAIKQEIQCSRRHPPPRITTNVIRAGSSANSESHLTTQDWLANLHAPNSTLFGRRDVSDQSEIGIAKMAGHMTNLPSPFSPLPGIESNHWSATSTFGIFESRSEDVTSPQFSARCFAENDFGHTSARTPRIGLSQRPVAQTVYSDANRLSVDYHTDELDFPSAGQLAMGSYDQGGIVFDSLSSEQDHNLFTPGSDESHRSEDRYIGRENSIYGGSLSDQQDTPSIPQTDTRSGRSSSECRCSHGHDSSVSSERNPFAQKATELLDLLSSVYKAGVSMSYLSPDTEIMENIGWLRTRLNMVPSQSNVIEPLLVPGDMKLEQEAGGPLC